MFVIPRQSLSRLCCLLISLLFAASAATSARADEYEEDSQRNVATLSVRLDAKGSALVFLGWGSGQPMSPALRQKLDEAIGSRLEDYRPEGFEEYADYEEALEEESGWHTFYGRADGAFRRNGLLVSGRLDLAPLARELRALGAKQLSVMLQLPQASGFNSVTGASPCNAQLSFYICSRFDLATDSPAPIAFSFGYRFEDLLWKWLPLAVFLLVPAGLTLWMRRRALRVRETDPAASWFGYFRFLNLAVTGTWLVWLPLYSWANPDEIFRFLSDNSLANPFGAYETARSTLSLGFEILKLAIYFVPPVLATVLCHLLSHKVFTRVRGMEWSPSEVARQALWSQAAFLAPLFFLLLGMNSLGPNPSFSAGCFVLGFVAWQVCARRSSKAQRWAPQALTTGALRDHIFDLAARAGVPLKQIYILPAGKGQMANAFARSDNTILLTDSLTRSLDEREVAAIVAHELAHLKERHPHTIGLIFVITIVVANVVVRALSSAASLDRWSPALFSAAIGAAMLVTHYFTRGYERHADALALTLTRDPEAFITALAKLARLNVLPMHWGGWDDAWSTHPSMDARVRRLAADGGITPERLRELLDAAQAEPLTAKPRHVETVETGKVFSTTFKAGQAQRISWTIIAAVAGAPPLLAKLLEWWSPAGTVKWLAYAGGLVAVYVFYQVIKNFAALWGQKALREGMRAKVAREGFDPAAGTFVGFAPAAAPRLYENNYSWDAGYIFLTDERLCYVGEETRFALKREQVAAVYLGDGPVDWLKRPTLYVRWRDREGNAGGTFYLYHGEVRSLRQSARKASVLYTQIRSWLERAATHPTASQPLTELSAPAYGSVTSLSPAEFLSTAKVVNGIIVLSVFALILGVAFGLSWAGIGYAVALTISVCLLDRVPYILKRKPAAEDAAEPAPYQQGAWAKSET